MPSTVKFPDPTSSEFGAKLPVSVKSLSSAFLLLSIAAVKLGPINNEPEPVLILILPLAVISVPAIVVNAPVLVVEIPTAPSKLVLAVITVPSIVVPAIVVLEAELLPITTPSILPVLIVTPLKATVPEVAVKFPLNIVLPFAVTLSNVPCAGVIEPITPSIVLAVTDLVVDPIIATPSESNTSPVKLPPKPVVAVTDVPSSVVNLPVVAPPTALPIAV